MPPDNPDNRPEDATPAGEAPAPEKNNPEAALDSAVTAAEQAAQALGGTSQNNPNSADEKGAAYSLPNLVEELTGEAAGSIDLLSDVNLNVKIELGRTRMFVEDVIKLTPGCVVELDKLAGDPVDIYVNERPVARGEVLVLNDNFCVRINEILPTQSAATAREENRKSA